MSTKFPLHLESLILKNLAIFEFQEVHFCQGFNAIIGETGSGKSLIVDALQIILGQRADKRLIRKNSEYALIEATFSCQDQGVKEFFNQIGHPFDDQEISIKRLIYPSGKTKSFLNFIPCSVNTLLTFSRHFVDLVGQFENQKLLSEDYQLYLIDSFGKIRNLLLPYQKDFKDLQNLKKERLQMEATQKSRVQKAEFLQFQIKELQKLSPSVEDEKELLEKKKSIQVREKKNKFLHEILGNLSGGDGSEDVLSLLKKIIQQIKKNPEFLKEDLANSLDSAYTLLEEVSYSLSREISGDETEEVTLDEVMERLDHYQKLKRKYGGSTESLVQMKKEWEEELELLMNLDQKKEDLDGQFLRQEEKTRQKAMEMQKARKKAAGEISEQLTKLVRMLKMNGATIKVEVGDKEDLDERGMSQIHFLAETNPGEGYHRIKDIASGGELSRILLAFRQVLAVKDSISIFLFDEIDAGVGGETALRIGKTLLQVAENSQVIAITHLPQIAHYAHKLIVVSKEHSLEDNHPRTRSAIREVSGKMIQQEIRTMIPLQ